MIPISDEQKKKVKKIKRVIYGRTLIVLLAVLIQLSLILLMILKLKNYSFIMYAIFAIISITVVLHLFNDSGNPDLKLVWMIPIAILPVFGGIFYLFIESQPGARLLKRRKKELEGEFKKCIIQNPEVKERLREENNHINQFSEYLYNYNGSPVYGNSKMTYYKLGDEQIPAMIEEIKKAEKFIFLEFFIVEEGYVWDSILEALKEKAAAGVEVRFMYDGMCSLTLLPTYYPKIMQKYGIKCKVFSQIYPMFSSHYNNRDHRKILVVDGRVAFTGGNNLADEYANKKVRFGHWKDVGVKIEGDAVERFTYMFLEMWNVTEKTFEDCSPYLVGDKFYTERDGYFIPYEVSPFNAEHIGKRVYLDILNTADRYVHIITPYLIIDYETIMALTYAAKRGVDVSIVMPHIPDKKYAFVLAKTYYNELLNAGAKIYEYTPGFTHAKVFVSDDVKATVGTVNLDYRSFYHHFECGVFIYNNSQISVMEQDFNDVVAQSVLVSKEDYRKLKWWERAEAKILRMIAPLM